MGTHDTLPLLVWAPMVEQCSCVGSGGDSGTADLGPEPNRAGIATQFQEVIPSRLTRVLTKACVVNNPAFPQPIRLAKQP